jgi:hypothetical protein
VCFEPITPRSLPQLKGDGVLQHESGMPVVPARRLVLLAKANQHHDILNLVVPTLCGLDRFEAVGFADAGQSGHHLNSQRLQMVRLFQSASRNLVAD